MPAITDITYGPLTNTALYTEGFDGQWIHTRTEFDSLGRAYRTAGNFYAGTTPTRWTTNSLFDALDRVREIRFPDGRVDRVVYNGINTTFYADALVLNQSRTERKNSLGELLQVTDANLRTSTYQYDAFGNLLDLTDTESKHTTMSYGNHPFFSCRQK